MRHVILHGISHCDKVKQAKVYLNEVGIDFDFRDYKQQPPGLNELQAWSRLVGWEMLLNKRGTTWRRLDPMLQSDLSATKVLSLLVDNPVMIKRPIITCKQNINIVVGFQPHQYQTFFSKSFSL
jgi:Spx/MgsR family transcriptional regulator